MYKNNNNNKKNNTLGDTEDKLLCTHYFEVLNSHLCIIAFPEDFTFSSTSSESICHNYYHIVSLDHSNHTPPKYLIRSEFILSVQINYKLLPAKVLSLTEW